MRLVHTIIGRDVQACEEILCEFDACHTRANLRRIHDFNRRLGEQLVHVMSSCL